MTTITDRMRRKGRRRFIETYEFPPYTFNKLLYVEKRGQVPLLQAAKISERYDMSLGAGLGRFKGHAFRIGHLGDFNDLMLLGTLCGVEMGLAIGGVPFKPGGVDAAMRSLCSRKGVAVSQSL